MYASHRRKNNSIWQLHDYHGHVITNKEMIGDLFSAFFSNLFTSSNPTTITGMNSKVTDATNSRLLIQFSGTEVKEDIFQMTPLSSLGPDGFLAHLY